MTDEKDTKDTKDDVDTSFMDASGSVGTDAAEAMIKEGRTKFDRLDYFSLKDGESIIVRFLNDMTKDSGPLLPWLTVKEHFAPTKPKPDDAKSQWPAVMGAYCRYDRIFNGAFKDCYICDHLVDGTTTEGKRAKAKLRTLALVAVREEVFEGGQFVGVKTKMKEASAGKDKGTELVQDIRLVSQSYDNFFGHLAGTAARHGTVLGRDYDIRRKGTEFDTSYNFSPLDPVDMELENGEVVPFDIRRPGILEDYFPKVPNLLKIIAEKATDDFYNRYFVPGDDDNESSKSEKAAPAAPPTDADPDRVKAMRDRAMRTYGAQDSTDAEKAQTETAEEPKRSGLRAMK